MARDVLSGSSKEAGWSRSRLLADPPQLQAQRPVRAIRRLPSPCTRRPIRESNHLRIRLLGRRLPPTSRRSHTNSWGTLCARGSCLASLDDHDLSAPRTRVGRDPYERSRLATRKSVRAQLPRQGSRAVSHRSRARLGDLPLGIQPTSASPNLGRTSAQFNLVIQVGRQTNSASTAWLPDSSQADFSGLQRTPRIELPLRLP